MQSIKWTRRQKEEKRPCLPYHKLLLPSSLSRWNMGIIILNFWTLAAYMEVLSILIRFCLTAQDMQIKTIIATLTSAKLDSNRYRRVISEIRVTTKYSEFNKIIKIHWLSEKKSERSRLRGFSYPFNSMFVGKSSQLGKDGFSSLHKITYTSGSGGALGARAPPWPQVLRPQNWAF